MWTPVNRDTRTAFVHNTRVNYVVVHRLVYIFDGSTVHTVAHVVWRLLYKFCGLCYKQCSVCDICDPSLRKTSSTLATLVIIMVYSVS